MLSKPASAGFSFPADWRKHSNCGDILTQLPFPGWSGYYNLKRRFDTFVSLSELI
ncbi:hypothetical protein D515_03662 [Grimontia indica]|uniref:Uncharacterized protein n=1 Tax=Grimontia indica TaxID=1056512 RepID=R1IQL5_9GAMM|nr:hypothetical protein D515_03662 [Grimontia indica]